MKTVYAENKEVIRRLNNALYDLDTYPDTGNTGGLEAVLNDLFAADCEIHLAFPFEDLTGPGELYRQVFLPLIEAVPDLERRVFLEISGPAERGDWIGCAGNYVGVFEHPWLDIPPTCHFVHMRFHEFYRIKQGKIVEMQGIWDIPQLMMQAKAWPMAPSLGAELMVPSPAVQDGLSLPPRDEKESAASMELVIAMLDGLQQHADGGPEAMHLDHFWHPKMTWYGPAGIGTNRRISGFRNWHQIPFLKALPDRGDEAGLDFHFFSDGPYVAVTGWPNMQMTVTGDGWLGIAPGGQRITMRSLDFWRCEKGMIRENWVLVDLLSVYDQLGVDVFGRMREITVDRQVRRPSL
ncbi:MAG: ester cyclase [Spirochaetia bacterium]|nr:ester cyclase [Spirochaetia bacterium]